MAVQSDDLRTTRRASRFDQIFKLFHEIVDMGVESDDICHVLMTG